MQARALVRRAGLVSTALAALGLASFAGEIVIRGRVLAPGGSPAPEVVVSALRSEGAYGRVASGMAGLAAGDPVVSTLTRVAGDFELRLESAGVYEISVEAAGHVPLRFELGPVVGYRNLPDVTLVADEGLLVRVVDGEGAPIEGALVTLGAPRSREPRFSLA